MIDIEAILKKSEYTFDDLVVIMKILRDKDIGCPWDIEQTHKSVRNNFIEEVYEAVEGIDTENDGLLEEELGDVLLQVVFHAQIAESEGSFNICDVADGICKKLILRHPHVFGQVKVSDSSEVLKNWDAIKIKEKSRKTLYLDVDEVARTLPSLIRISKIRKKMEKAGKLLTDTSTSVKFIYDELSLMGNDVTSENIANLLVAVTDIARKHNIDSEQVLYDECEKQIKHIKI